MVKNIGIIQMLIALNAYEKVFVYSLFLPCAKHVNELCAR